MGVVLDEPGPATKLNRSWTPGVPPELVWSNWIVTIWLPGPFVRCSRNGMVSSSAHPARFPDTQVVEPDDWPWSATSNWAAATYGPTNGPPDKAPLVPTGMTSVVVVSLRARAALTRPLPVSDLVPAGSALRASRPTIVPGEAALSAPL